MAVWALTRMVIISLIFLSCNPEQNIYKGRVVELDYSNTNELKDKHWIKIDDWKFTHYRDRKEGLNNQFSLPASNIVYDSLAATGRTIKTRVNSRTIPLHLARYLKVINQSNNKSSAKYEVINPSLASIEGKLQVAKTDSGVIKVTTSVEYPIEINILVK